MQQIVHYALLVFITSCANLDLQYENKENPKSSLNNAHTDQQSYNLKGWNNSNCAHILADGSCAHKIGSNILNPVNNDNGSPANNQS